MRRGTKLDHMSLSLVSALEVVRTTGMCGVVRADPPCDHGVLAVGHGAHGNVLTELDFGVLAVGHGTILGVFTDHGVFAVGHGTVC